MDPRIARTQYAAKAAALAEQFQNALAEHAVGEHRVEMTAPEASTAGGVQSLQHIRLVPPHGSGRTYVVGNANRIEGKAELRSLHYVNQVSLQRFGEPTGFDPDQYAAFVAAATQFLDNFGLTVAHATRAVSLRPSSMTTTEPKVRHGFSPLAVAVIVIWSVAVLAIGLAVGVAATRAKLGH
jgi:hypothetical protein